MAVGLVVSLLLVVEASWAQEGLREPGQNGALDQATSTAQGSSDAIRKQISYSLGLNIGNDLRRDGVDFDLASLVAGLTDGCNGSEPRLSQEQIGAAMEEFQRQMQRRNRARLGEAGKRNMEQAVAFLAANRDREGIVETNSGLQYKIIKQGNGPSPKLSDTVRTHYRGTLLDGTEFDSSFRSGQPAEFPVAAVIPGWTEALQSMHVGDKWQLFIPPQLAYGANPPGPPIEPNQLLVFEIELVGISQ